MTRVIVLESNISSFWTRSHLSRIIFDETINEMFSRINNLALLRQRLDRDAKSLQITFVINSIGHFTVVCLDTWPRMQARMELTLL